MFLGSRNQLTATASAVLSPLISGAAIISAERKSVDSCFVHARIFVAVTASTACRAYLTWAEVCCSIYSTLATSLLRLERRALPLTVSFADGGFPQAFREKLDQKLYSRHSLFPLFIFLVNFPLSFCQPLIKTSMFYTTPFKFFCLYFVIIEHRDLS